MLPEDIVEGRGVVKYQTCQTTVYNSNLDIVSEFYVPGVFNGFVEKKGRIMLWFSKEDKSPLELYYDIFGEEEKIYDDYIRKYFSSPSIVEEPESVV